MKEIISVRGTRNVGKTTSIKMVQNLLKKNYPSAKFTILKDGADIIISVEINAVIIILASAGDTPKILKEMLEKIGGIDWDIIVCATKTRGKTITIIENCCSNATKIPINKTPSPSNQEAANKATAHEILNHIQKALGQYTKQSLKDGAA